MDEAGLPRWRPAPHAGTPGARWQAGIYGAPATWLKINWSASL